MNRGRSTNVAALALAWLLCMATPSRAHVFSGAPNTFSECTTGASAESPGAAACRASVSLLCGAENRAVPWRQFFLLRERNHFRIYTARHVLEQMRQTQGCALRFSDGSLLPFAISRFQSDGRDIAWARLENSELPASAATLALGRFDRRDETIPFAARVTCASGADGYGGVIFSCVSSGNAEAVPSLATERHCVPTVQGFSGGPITVSDGNGHTYALGVHVGSVATDGIERPGDDPREARQIPQSPCSSTFYNRFLVFPEN